MDKQLVPQPNVRAIQQVRAGSSSDDVPHISFEHVQALSVAAKQEARKGKGERDQLMIQTIFDGMFRIAEALTLRPNLIVKDQDGFSARIVGKGKRSREVALSPTIANRLLAYAYEFGVEKDSDSFPSHQPEHGRLSTAPSRLLASSNLKALARFTFFVTQAPLTVWPKQETPKPPKIREDGATLA